MAVKKLTTWIWCERLGHPQVAIAELFQLRETAVSQMLRRAREGGRTEWSAEVEAKVLEKLELGEQTGAQFELAETGYGARDTAKPAFVALVRDRNP